MADISTEIAAFQNAVYGEDVRSAMISLANKLNNTITPVVNYVDDYRTDLSNSSKNYEEYINEPINVLNLLYTKNKAIDENGNVVNNLEYCATDEIKLKSGSYTIKLVKTPGASFLRIHGYKNNNWVKQITYSNTSVNVINNIDFVVDDDIDAVRFSYPLSTVLFAIDSNALSLCEVNNYQLKVRDLYNGYIATDYTRRSDSRNIVSKMMLCRFDTIVHFDPGNTIDTMRVVKFKDQNYIGQTEYTSSTTDVFIDAGTTICILFKNHNTISINTMNYDANVVIETNHYVNNIEIPLEPGGYSTYQPYAGISSINSYVRSMLPLYVNNLDRLLFKFGGKTTRCRCIDENGNLIGGSSINLGSNDGWFSIPSGTSYMLFEQTSTDLTPIIISFAGGNAFLGKRTDENANNPILVPFITNPISNKSTNLCYMLPPNYSANGSKVPLIVWFDGSAGYPSIDSTFSSNKLPGLKYMRDEGYAIMQVYAWGRDYATSCPDCGKDMPYPTRTCLESIKAAIEYMCDRYNIDPDNVHVVSKSFGGIISSYFVSKPIWPFKSISMFSPCIDVLSMRGRFKGGRLALIEDLELEGSHVEDFKDISMTGETETGVENYYFSPRCQPLWLDNFEKLISINPAWTYLFGESYETKYQNAISDAQQWWAGDKFNVNLYDDSSLTKLGKIPCKIWIGDHDADTPYQIMVSFVEQLKNAGCYAVASVIENGGHSTPDFSYGQPITTKLGIYYGSVAIGWREAIEWIRLNSNVSE